jgi:ketosteroid isomerase-like protein
MTPQWRSTDAKGLYEAFNRRDIDGVLAMMSDDVDWPSAWKGGASSDATRCATTGVRSGNRSIPTSNRSR